jgi:hypothetical protein
LFSTPHDLARHAQHLLAVHDQSVLGRWLRTSLAPHATIGPAWNAVWRGSSPTRDGSPTTMAGRDEPLPRPHTGRYVVICTNAVYYGPCRGRLTSLRAVALRSVSA